MDPKRKRKPTIQQRDCRLPRKETNPKPKKNETVVFRDFFTAGLRLPVSKKFADIFSAYNVQIHQLTPNSIPQILKFLWSCRTFGGTNDVDTFVRHFETHWAKKVLIVDGEEREAQYVCCTFQTQRINKNLVPMELAHAYKNKWANKWNSYWFYATIPLIGRNEQREEVTSYDPASQMTDLEVQLVPELTKGSCSSESTSAYFQATHAIATRDALEEFVVADIWPSRPQWGSWTFTRKQLHELDYEVRSPKFNVQRPEGKTDEEIKAEIERKVIQMIGNYTHKEWEVAQKILKHQDRVNRVLEEMGISCPPRPRPSTPGKKMQLPGNVGSEAVWTSKKCKSAKTTAATEGSSKLAKASEALAR
jgi:hypothetical protein